MNRNVVLLAFCQGMFLTNNVTFIAINGLMGLALAPVGWMATLPVMGYVVGAAFSAPMVARLQRARGRKRSFQIGLVVLEPCTHTDAKSAIRWMEFSLLGLASVLSTTATYAELRSPGEDVLFARGVDDWVHNVQRLIDDPDLRLRLARAAYAKAWQRFQPAHGQLRLVAQDDAEFLAAVAI